MNLTRLFFGFEVVAEWPPFLQERPAEDCSLFTETGKILDPTMRHITVAFLGSHALTEGDIFWHSLPMLPCLIGPVALADCLLFLPETASRVVAARVQWLEIPESVIAWQKAFVSALRALKYTQPLFEWVPHLTLARGPFEKKWWQEHFSFFPFFVRALHLYESLGHSQYRSLWSYPLLAPFEELPHTADRAWKIRGESIEQIHRHAQIALGMQQPKLLRYMDSSLQADLDRIVIDLNQMITVCDSVEGSEFKAVSFHGQLQKEGSILTWEMVVDV